MSVETFAAAAQLRPEMAARWYPHVMAAADRYDFRAPLRLAMWIAQVGHESGGFRTLAENLNYSLTGIRKTWPGRFPSDASAAPYVRSAAKLANSVYADRMGNGDTASGDGWRFRGRGLIQITGRESYGKCGKALGIDLLSKPDLLTEEKYAALSAGWYWDSRGLSALADGGHLEKVTRRINGGTHGLADREARLKVALAALAGPGLTREARPLTVTSRPVPKPKRV